MSLKTHIFLCFILSVSARFIDTKKEENVMYVPASEAQKNYIAATVCEESFGFLFNFSTVAIEKCKENFGWQLGKENTDQKSGFQERCRSPSGSSGVTVTLEVPTYNNYQIVLLIPDPNDNSEVIYNIVKQRSKYTDGLVIAQDRNYVTYSTQLDRTFTPRRWYREADINGWKPESKDYDVQVKFNVTGDRIDGLFTWNHTGKWDKCFDLDIACQERTFTEKIYPNLPPSAVVKNLPPNDSCNINLKGLYGITEVYFETPAYKVPDKSYSAEDPGEIIYDKLPFRENSGKVQMQMEGQDPEEYVDKVGLDKLPYDMGLRVVPHERKADKVLGSAHSHEVRDDTSASTRILKVKPNFTWVDDIQIMAEEDGEKWRVHVSWTKPPVIPDKYNVTLQADNIVFTSVPGNATGAELRGVKGTGIYSVSVYAILGDIRAHNSVRALFPYRTERGESAGVVRWAVAAGGAWAAAALAAGLYWLRACRGNIMTQVKPKLHMEGKLKELPQVEPPLEPPPAVDSWEIKPERLTLREVIGEGAFGVVRRGTLAPAGKEVAVKMLKDFPTLEEMRAFHLEMELMKSVGAHPHVVSLVGCCTTRQPAIVAEYCSRGDLLNFLRGSWDVMISKRNANYYNNNTINTSDYRNDLFKTQEHSRLVVNKMYDFHGVCDTELTSLDLLSFCRQIAMGMEFLSLNKVVHRDLAARNILVTGDRTLKIADFGLSRDVYEENQYKQKGNGKMPVKWMALESLTRRIYTTQSDVWSFGVVVWEIVTVGGAPYAGVEAARLPRLLRAGYRMPRPPNCSHHLYELIRACWAARPRDRPTFAELHARLDELLNSASADEYLSLELDDEPPPAPIHHRYFRIILRAKRNWSRGESYERPLKAPHNHYTSPPVTYKTPV